jgi:hypothetical protein
MINHADVLLNDKMISSFNTESLRSKVILRKISQILKIENFPQRHKGTKKRPQPKAFLGYARRVS